jgi:hypothetical protein
MRGGFVLALVLVLGSAGAGLAAPLQNGTIHRLCEVGHPCHHCTSGRWWCPSANRCITKNQICRVL